METMYDTLLQLPLFQGLGSEDFTTIVGKVKLHFTRHKAGEILIKKGTLCLELVFVLKGKIFSSRSSADGLYSFMEFFQAPYLIEPQSLFGMDTAYMSDYVAEDEVHTISISKSFVFNELFKYEIFRLNYMNIISNRAQTQGKRLWTKIPLTEEERILDFILFHMERLSGKKVIKIKMETLAGIINGTRLNVSKVLHDMQERKLLELHRGEIIIPDVSRLC